MISYRNSDGVYFMERSPEFRKTAFRLQIGGNVVYYPSRSEAQLAAWMALDVLEQHGTMRLYVRHRVIQEWSQAA